LELITKTRAWARGNSVINPPPELSLYSKCKEFHCLPDAGGWYDQSHHVCKTFSIISAIEAEEQAKKNKKK